MPITVVGLVTTPREADNLARDLTSACRCSATDINLITQEADDGGVSRSGGAGSGALAGAVAGAVIGGIAGYFASMTALTVPVLDISLSGRPIEAALAGAGICAVIGILLGAIAGAGRRRDNEFDYGVGMRRAGTLVTVHARDNAQADCVVRAMREHGAMEIDKRSSDWAKHDLASRSTEPVLRPDPEVATGGLPSGSNGPAPRHSAPSSPEPALTTRSYNRPMEETTAGKPASSAGSLAAAVNAAQKQQAAAPVDTRNWITRKYTATYFGPERRKAANQTPYQGAERRQSA